MRISDWSSDVCSSDLIKVGSLPSGDGGVPDDGTVTAAKITADTGEQAALRVKIGAASSTALTALDGTVSDLSGTVTTPGTTVGALQTALVRPGERRGGKAGVSPGRSRWSRDH